MSDIIYPTESFFKALNDTFQVVFTHIDDNKRGFEIPVLMMAILTDDDKNVTGIEMKVNGQSSIYPKGHVFTEPIGRIQGYEKNTSSEDPVSLQQMLSTAHHLDKARKSGISY